MRHPYVTLIVLGLATVGAMSVGEKVKCFFYTKTRCISNMMKKNTDIMGQE